MHLLRTRRGLLLGFVVLALVGAACGKAATASEGGGSSSGSGSGTSTGSSGTSGGNGGSGYGAGGGGGMMATTVLEGPHNGFTFSPSTVKGDPGPDDHARERQRHHAHLHGDRPGHRHRDHAGQDRQGDDRPTPRVLSVRLPFPRVDGHEGDLGGQTLIDWPMSSQRRGGRRVVGTVGGRRSDPVG